MNDTSFENNAEINSVHSEAKAQGHGGVKAMAIFFAITTLALGCGLAYVYTSKNKLDNTLEVSFVPMTLIDSEFNNNFTYELQRWETVKSGFSHFADNDIGIAKITPCFENRKSVIFKNLKNKYGAGTTELHILRTNNEYIFNEYVFWFIKTDTFIKEGINNFTGFKPAFRITNADETSTITSNADISKPILSSFTAAKISKPMPATTSIIRQTDTKKRFIMPSLNL